jgi:hypothetical protein
MKEKIAGYVGAGALVLSILIGAVTYTTRTAKPDKPDKDDTVQVDPQPAPDPTPTPTPAPTPKPDGLVEIVAPDKVKPGELVVLAADGDATSFSWQVIPATDNFLQIDGGRRAVFSSGSSGKFMFVLAVAKDGKVEVKTHTIQVGVSGPSPTPGPTPTPQPTDDFAMRVVAWCEAVDSPTKRDDALKLSQSFISVAATISSGVIKTPGEILEVTKTANRAALGDAGVQAWAPFLESLRAELNAMGKAGKLDDADAHAELWQAIGDALRSYAESM